ncbi:aminotransferase class I/II-fold pyridoxal phosphate-dependent enzyme [Breznakia pachnodae]|uniref:Aminotransferase n=1 Tax=Breznakia pachnodae TaxID=265178 RepID=A0ABU0E843_9FIRM|nr:aminotransferase class I/II-fold pyridoxal phosphate-dependent enzyme [Breznakia pachnodae]MDQ0363076.1 aspartate/methionine/tyrosine aminotransferase [Breznakia pachnodae]
MFQFSDKGPLYSKYMIKNDELITSGIISEKAGSIEEEANDIFHQIIEILKLNSLDLNCIYYTECYLTKESDMDTFNLLYQKYMNTNSLRKLVVVKSLPKERVCEVAIKAVTKKRSALFSDDSVDLSILKKKAFNYRWAEVEEGIIPLTAADIDFPVAEEIKSALMEYIEEGYFSYTPKRGLPEFKESIANNLRKKGIEINNDYILPIDSAARAMYIASAAVLCKEDEAIVFNPVDFLFKESVLAAGATAVSYPAKIIDERIDVSKLEDYISEKTKMICLCNPHNPLGKLYHKEELEEILKIANKYNLWVMNDEIWSDIVYENDFVSIMNMKGYDLSKVINIYGFSKAYGLAGLRIAYMYCDNQELFDKVVKASDVDSTAGGISSLSQVAGIACLEKADYWKRKFVEKMKENRDYAVSVINQLPLVKSNIPEATYLLYIDIKETGMNSSEFVNLLEEKYHVSLIPGSSKFFGTESEGYVRLCLATSREILSEGLKRISIAVKDIAENKL